MHDTGHYVPATPEQVRRLSARGCSAADWSAVHLAPGFDLSRLVNIRFSGVVFIASQAKSVRLFGGIEKPCGIFNASIHNCCIGPDVYIANVKNHIANYTIAAEVIIDNIDLLAVEGDSAFGNGIEARVINENGGREVPIFDRLSAHLAYIIALYRHRPVLQRKLRTLIDDYVRSVTSDIGTVDTGACLFNCGYIKNVRIGPRALLEGVSLLENGSVNSCPEDPVHIGPGVIARDFILSSGARVGDGSILARCFVGQAAEIAKTYSAENTLFFANCACFHGEACSVFAGPYTVSHHKATLLIAGLFSFFNAGSGSNQSNHMYKLGALHQGILERGAKTTSDSYILYPARVGAFSVVIGRHYTNPDTSDLPYSYLIESGGESFCVPGVCLRNIGTVRDSLKWPARDKRKDPDKLDLITFDLLNPCTAQKILNGLSVLSDLRDNSASETAVLEYRGTKIRRASLENGIRLYQLALDRYLGNIVVERLMERPLASRGDLAEALTPLTDTGRGKWLDLAGLIADEASVLAFLDDLEAGRIDSLSQAHDTLCDIHENYKNAEWTWIRSALETRYAKPVDEWSPDQLIALIRQWSHAHRTLDELRIQDAEKEFSLDTAIGFGVDGCTGDTRADFLHVRGESHTNAFLADIRRKIALCVQTADDLVQKLSALK